MSLIVLIILKESDGGGDGVSSWDDDADEVEDFVVVENDGFEINVENDILATFKFLLNLGVVLVDFIDSIKPNTGLKINFIELDDIHCSSEQNNYIFRIIQEIIINTNKHANAQVLDIEISMKENYLLIRTCDDGIGFDYSIQSQSSKKGYGLLDMQNKVEFLKGFLSFNDENKKGTQINIKIPLTNN